MVVMMISFVLLLILMSVLGGGALLAIVLVLAAAKNRPGLAATIGGVALLGLLVAVAVVMAYVGIAAPAASTVSISSTGPPGFSAGYTSGTMMLARGVSMFRVVLLVAVVGLVIAMLWRSGNSKATSGWGRWWPVLLIPLVGLFFLGSIRVHTKTERPAASPYAETLRVRQHIAEQQSQIARHNAQLAAEIEKMDIHELMDKADAPRIALAPDPPPAPAPEATSDEASVATEPSDASEEPTTTSDPGEPAEDAPAETESAPESTIATKDSEPGEPASATELAGDEAKNGDTGADAEVSAESDVAEDRDQTPSNLADEDPASAPRPPWVDDPPKRVGNTWREVLIAGEYATVEECYKAADVYLLLTTYNRLMQLAGTPEVMRSQPELKLHHDQIWADGQLIVSNGRPNDWRLNYLARVGIGIDFVRREIAKDEYLATTERSMGPMKTLYTLVEFTPAVDRELQARWDAYRRQERFAVVGVGAASVIGLLGILWGLLKIDTLTKGYYTKWLLFLGAPAAIIGGGFLSMVIADTLSSSW